jgi:thiol-disulfide isomerase/thioredoxin
MIELCLIVLFGIRSHQSFDKDLLIRGNIKNASDSKISFTLGNDPITRDKDVINLNIDDKGDFRITYKIHSPRGVVFLIDNNRQNSGNFTAFPGDSIVITGDLLNLKGSLKFSGSNRNYDKYRDLFLTGSEKFNNIDFNDSKVNWNKIHSDLNRITNQRLSLLENVAKFNKFSKIEYEYAWDQIKYVKYSIIFSLIGSAKKSGDAGLIQKLYTYDIPVDSAALISSFFSDYVDTFIGFKYLIKNNLLDKKVNIDITYLKGIYDLGLNQLNGLTRDAFLTRQIYYGFKHGIAGIIDLYTNYQNDCKSIYFKEIINNEYDLFKITIIKKGKIDYSIDSKPQPDFSEFVKGFNGKVLLIEFWGSWCIPCIKAIPVLKEIERQFSGQDFMLIHVAVSDSHENLDFAIKKYELDGHHILLSDEVSKQWKKTVNFYSVPYYAIIDYNGKIIYQALLDYMTDSPKITRILNETIKSKR